MTNAELSAVPHGHILPKSAPAPPPVWSLTTVRRRMSSSYRLSIGSLSLTGMFSTAEIPCCTNLEPSLLECTKTPGLSRCSHAGVQSLFIKVNGNVSTGDCIFERACVYWDDHCQFICLAQVLEDFGSAGSCRNLGAPSDACGRLTNRSVV